MKEKHDISHDLITALSLIAPNYFCPNGNHLSVVKYDSESEFFSIEETKDGESICDFSFELTKEHIRIICKAMRRNYPAYYNTVKQWEHIYNKVIHFFES